MATDAQAAIDRTAALLGVIMSLVTSLEKAKALKRSDWVPPLRALRSEFETKEASADAQDIIREILSIFDPPKKPTLHDGPQRRRWIPTVIDGGKPTTE